MDDSPDRLISVDLSPVRTAIAMVSGLAYLAFATIVWFLLSLFDLVAGAFSLKKGLAFPKPALTGRCS
jgi:hypothetical protein